MSKRNRMKNVWKVVVPEETSTEPYMIKTSPVVLGCSSQCDIVINNPSVAESHVQFVLINDGKFLEIYNLAGEGSGGVSRTFLNGEPVDRSRLKADKDKFFTLKAGEVHLRIMYGASGSASSSAKKMAPRGREIFWFYNHDGVQYGPVNREALGKAVCDGTLLPIDDVWHSGIEKRIKAFEVPDLFDPKMDADDETTRLCPYCWHKYPIDELLYIARHPDLTGDPVLGSEEQSRFLPRDFMPVRRVVDMRGEICTDVACPRCHLRIPVPFLDTVPLFLSIIGTPGSGKSYYLASSTWMLRKMLPRYFGLTFEDVDNVTNQWLNAYEEALFFPVDDVDYHAIEKTQIEASELSRQVKINDITMLLPQPAIFTLLSRNSRVTSGSNSKVMSGNSSKVMSGNSSTVTSGNTSIPWNNSGGEKSEPDEPFSRRTLAVYDNAGEHFQTGQDVIQRPGTLHMLHAHGFLFLFDPTSDPRFTGRINENVRDKIVRTNFQQQKILIETIDRIRKYTGLTVMERFEKPIVVGLSKVDLLSDYFSSKGVKLKGTPLKWLKKGESAALDIEKVRAFSLHIRALFQDLAPEYVNTVESFAQEVIYLPVSAIGHQPDNRGVAIKNVNPIWVEVPFLYILSQLGHIQAA
ncbi:hypothetical protein MTBBW1_2030021 [Desulfamplus magnetovallimortis]|uniref:FHA domain-containing protein n=1 Tax=Desulfamplus magnetovallimortis TaxID=1246637 RepID=A0A1W1HBQ2_9BACT|nr:GYF domain-containing protein [Desulfamplus magnetovallimortis]SLM29931.1 hypothetical protein MTBBW1_2030021 [Desulfamplus magnetovallimortis]